MDKAKIIETIEEGLSSSLLSHKITIATGVALPGTPSVKLLQ